IGPAHSQEATNKHIADGGNGTDPERGAVRHAKHAFEQACTCNHAGSTVNRKENQNDKSRNNTQDFFLVVKTIREIIRQGQGVVLDFSMYPQTTSDQQPVEPGTNDQTDGNPHLRQTGKINRTGQTHQEPATHVGSPCRKCSYETP